MAFEVLDEVDASWWNGFVANSPGGHILQTFEWGELKRRTDWNVVRGVLRRDGEPVAAVSLLERRVPLLGRNIAYCPRGPVLDWSDSDLVSEAVAAVSQLARERRDIALTIDPALPDGAQAASEALRAHGFSPSASSAGFGGLQPRCVMRLDITPDLDDILARFKSKWRYNVRLAARKGVRVREGKTIAEMDRFYDLLLSTARRDGFVVRARQYFHWLHELFLERDLGELLLAEHDGQLLAGIIVLTLGRQSWYLYGASSNEQRNLMPNHLIQWEAIQRAKARGCTVYDFRGVSQEADPMAAGKLSGLNRFKAGFGAQFVRYIGQYDLVVAPVAYRLYRTGQAARKWRTRLARG